MFLEQKATSEKVREVENYEDVDETVEMDESVDEDMDVYEDADEIMDSMIEETDSLVTAGRKTSRSSSLENTSVYEETSSEEPFDFLGGANVGLIFAVPIISLIITILVFVLLVQKKKAPKSRFLKWLREFLNFRSILIAGLIKFFYLFLATLLTIGGFVMMFMGKDDMVVPMILIGLAIVVFGNIILRLIMEGMMIMIGLWENTNDMRAVMVKDEEAPEEEPVDKPEEKSGEASAEGASVESEPSVEQPEPSVGSENAVAPSNVASLGQSEASAVPVDVKKA